MNHINVSPSIIIQVVTVAHSRECMLFYMMLQYENDDI